MTEKEKLFQILNSFFDKIYLITLKRSSDRHKTYQHELKGLEYEIFWGVDGKELSRDELYKQGLYHPSFTKLLKKRIGRRTGNMSLGQIGCALSHVGVYNEIIRNQYQTTLILEDDVKVVDSTVSSFQHSLKDLPVDWDLLYLGYSGSNSSPTPVLKFQNLLLSMISSVLSNINRLRKLDPQVIKNTLSQPYSENLNKSGANFGTHAYGITLDAAKMVREFQTPVVQESDNVLGELCSYRWLNAFDLKERVFIQNKDLPSTIDK